MERIYPCKLYDSRPFTVRGGISIATGENSQPVISVGTIDVSLDVNNQIDQSEAIRKKVNQTCKSCSQFIKNDGKCRPATYFANNGFVATVAVIQDSEKVPERIISDPKYYFKKVE